MSDYLLDTNVLSELARPTPDVAVLGKLAQVEARCSVAAVTWHELRYGVERLPSGRRREALGALMTQWATRFPILPYSRVAAEWHGAERARLEQLGRSRPFVDGQIAAVAATNRLKLVTRNLSDFDGYDELEIESWW